MKKIANLLALVIVVLPAFGCGADPKDPPKTEANVPPSGATPTPISSAGAPASGAKIYPQTTKAISARVGETFNVVLPGNVTTPFEWRFDESPDKNVVAMTAHNYTDAPPANCQGCDGYKGTFNFTFTAKADGAAKLHFSYARATPGPNGSAAPAEKEMTVDVHVTH